MDEILISIIVPAYNIEQYIGRCLDSILNQTHKKLQIIVVNDGSSDKTGEILDQYALADNRISVIHKSNGGVSSARIAGIEMALGEYIGFVDGDDYIEPDMYEVLLKNAIKYQADISHCGYKMIYPDGHIDNYYGTGQLREQKHDTALNDLLQGKQIEPSLGNKLFYKKTIEGFSNSSLWDENIRINEDLLMNYLFFKKANKAVYEDKTFYHYILRKGSAATTKKERYKILDPLKVMTIIKSDVINSKELYSIVYQRYLRNLINIAVQQEWKGDAQAAKNALRVEIATKKINEHCTSTKIKLMAVGVAYFGGVYRVVRKLYERVTGISKKYQI